ncbi:MAG: Gfo/Idh/MocA family oxidoreductase [Treponema sp.]|jgi:predicted dehydrogenase|nr:Gfo/Idh/MocA family oxidoreductase [Treponema sp.]
MEKLRAALVGLGRIGSLLEDDPLREKPCTHAGALAANPDCVLIAGADRDEARRRLFAERWGPPGAPLPVYADAALMLAEQRPHILHIATHPDSHYFYCSLASRYGVKLAVCEKPLADRLSEARKIAALHRSGKITIITNHERRYAADYREAAGILAREELGPLLSLRGTLYMGKTRRLLDVLWHDGTHLADAAMFLSASVLRHKSAWGAPLRSKAGTAYLSGILEKTGKGGNGAVQTGGRVPFLLELGAGRDHLVFELEFSCAGGRLRIGNGIFEVWESGESPYAEGFRSLKKSREGYGEPTAYFSGMVEDAAACVRDKSRTPVSPASAGLRVIEYLHSVSPWGV